MVHRYLTGSMVSSMRLQRQLGSLAIVVAAVVMASGTHARSILLGSPQQPPVFRAEANLIEVIVRVTDEAGRFVPRAPSG